MPHAAGNKLREVSIDLTNKAVTGGHPKSSCMMGGEATQFETSELRHLQAWSLMVIRKSDRGMSRRLHSSRD